MHGYTLWSIFQRVQGRQLQRFSFTGVQHVEVQRHLQLQLTFSLFFLQLRIKIECAFSMFVCRWAILRHPIPASMGIRKSAALVMALCKLHNCCADCCLRHLEVTSNDDKEDAIPESTPRDALGTIAGGGIPIVQRDNNRNSPDQLLHRGHHHQDTTRAFRQQFARCGCGGEMPRDRLRKVVFAGGFKRPTPACWLRK